MDGERPGARRTGEETRRLLLETGMELLLARGVTPGVGHIRLQEVVRRAHLTTGAAYRLWSDQDDFHRDLAVAVTRWRDAAPVATTRAIVEDPSVRAGGLDEVIRLAAAAHIHSIGDDGSRSSRLFLAALALRASARRWDVLSQASVERHAESIADFGALYGALMTAFGHRMRAPLTIDDFTVAIAALGEGFSLQAVQGLPHPVFAERDEPGGLRLRGGEWTLFGLAVRALSHEFMEPAEPDGAQAARLAAE